MKYTTKELMSMTQEEIHEICDGQCETKRCLFKKSLWKYLFDGYCLRDTIQRAKIDIVYIESDILVAKKQIREYKEEIKFNEKRIKAIEKEINL